jgi:hypothetical protein
MNYKTEIFLEESEAPHNCNVLSIKYVAIPVIPNGPTASNKNFLETL